MGLHIPEQSAVLGIPLERRHETAPRAAYTKPDAILVLDPRKRWVLRHEQLLGRYSDGSAKTHFKAAYSEPFCKAFAAALRTGWHLGHRAIANLDLPCLLLSDILDNVAIDFDRIKSLGRRSELPPPDVSASVVHQAPAAEASAASRLKGRGANMFLN